VNSVRTVGWGGYGTLGGGRIDKILYIYIYINCTQQIHKDTQSQRRDKEQKRTKQKKSSMGQLAFRA